MSLSQKDSQEVDRYEQSLKRRQIFVNIITAPFHFVEWIGKKLGFADEDKNP